MNRLKIFTLSALIMLNFSCKKGQDKYAIKDFRKSLQPFLSKIVSEGLVTYQDSAAIKSISDDELTMLEKAENPILRATALQEMMDRVSFNTYDIVKNHLGDTAIVASDNGEFGIKFETVSDCLINVARWETANERDKTIEAVLSKHDYLESAYTILTSIEAQEKYYPYIKDMATRPRRLSRHEGYELGFNEIEYALFGLAGFKKKEDVQIIKNKMMNHVWDLSYISFRLMKEFPDTAYLDVLQEYHRRQFYMFSGNRPHGFTGYNADKASPENFIDALVVQQNERSASLLDTILIYLPKVTCMPDKETILDHAIEQIWNHPCPAYTRIREKVKFKAKKILEGRLSLDPIDIPIDTTKRRYHWYY